MKKKYMYIVFALLLSFVAVGCSSDDDYNADTAVSYYVPGEYDRMVSSITISNTVDGKEYTEKFDFVYDAQNRIKEINGKFKRWIGDKHNILCNTTTQANYYYKNDVLLVEWTEVNDYEDEIYDFAGRYLGVFNENGTLDKFSGDNFSGFDCEYQGMMLKKAYFDTKEWCEFGYDRSPNTNLISASAYALDSLDQKQLVQSYTYTYTPKANKTNIDFASLLGYNIVERTIPDMQSTIYSLFQLGAFGMFGPLGTHLPAAGEWTFDEEGFPLTLTEPSGRKYVIEYK